MAPMSEMREAMAAIKKARSVVIATHVSPEGDAIGSELGLAISLTKMGKEVSVINSDPVPEFLRFLPGVAMVIRGERIERPSDLLIVVDCEPGRTGLKELEKAPVGKILNIDHHITNPRAADINWVDPEAAAAGEMVYDLLAAMDAPIDKDVATNLYTAIFTDTGSFRYSNTDEAALAKSGRLLSYGVNPWAVSENIYETKSFGRMRLLGLVLSGLERNDDGRVAWVTVRESHYRSTGTSAEDTDGFVNYPRSVRGVEVALLFREVVPDKVKVSLRSKGRVDVSALAASIGGGGHPNASGAVMTGTVDGVKAEVVGRTDALVKQALA